MRIYADTSVFGGVFDEEFAEPTKKFFLEIDAGLFRYYVASAQSPIS